MKLYGLIGPSGDVLFVSDSSWDAWVYAFDSQSDEFRTRYWKRVTPSRKALRRIGYKVVVGRFVTDVIGIQ